MSYFSKYATILCGIWEERHCNNQSIVTPSADTLEAEMLASLKRQQQEEAEISPAASPRRGESSDVDEQDATRKTMEKTTQEHEGN